MLKSSGKNQPMSEILELSKDDDVQVQRTSSVQGRRLAVQRATRLSDFFMSFQARSQSEQLARFIKSARGTVETV